MTLLNQVTVGKQKSPHMVLVYGPDGVGKTTFASNAPEPIFLCAESGTDFLDVARLELSTYLDFKKALTELAGDGHKYKTVVIDSLDWLETLVWDHVCAQKGWGSIDEPSFGRGYAAALSTWEKVIEQLKTLRFKRKLNVVLIAHSHTKTVHDPQTGEAWDRYQLKMHDKAAAAFREFVHCVLFMNYQQTATPDKTGKVKVSGGARMLFTERRPGFDAKNRQGLPPDLPADWDSYQGACDHYFRSEADIFKNIQELLKGTNVTDKIRGQVSDSMNGASAEKLAQIENRLRTLQ